MSWELAEEHLAFQKVCRAFVDDRVVPLVDEADSTGDVPRELWRAMGDAGLLGLGVPEVYGGSEAGAIAIAILAEELAKASSGIAITPLVSSYMAAPHIVRSGTELQRERYLPGLVSGDLLAAIAVTEPGAGSDVAGIRTKAVAQGDGWRLNGTKMFITNAGLADVMIVAAKTDGAAGHRGISNFLVPTGATGLAVGPPLRKLGWRASDTREVVLDDVHVSADALLGELGRGFYQIMHAFQLERLVLAAMGLGLASACLDDATAYVSHREAFGERLVNKQTIRHRLAKMHVVLEAAQAVTYRAAARLENDHPERERSIAVAKYYAAQAANRIADEAVQLFGGAGFIDQTSVTRHYRDARILRLGGGTDEVQLEILSKRLLPAPVNP